MITKSLILTDKIIGGEYIAIDRLLMSFKNKYPTFLYEYLVLPRRKSSNKRFSFVSNLIKYFLNARLKIDNQISIKKVDYILVSDYLWAIAAKCVKPKNVKLIFMFHGLRSLPFSKVSNIDYRQILIKTLERISWLLSDAIVVPSEIAKDYVSKNIGFIAHKKLFLVPNIVPKVFFSGSKRHNNGRFTILFSGRLDKFKGLENLTTAYSRFVSKFPKSSLLFAYPSKSANIDIKKNIEKIIYQYRLKEKAKFIADSTEKELVRLYSQADVLVLPSELEFAPISVLEAMASGTPVIATNVGNIGGLLKNVDPNLILKNNSPKEILQKLLRFCLYKKIELNNISKKSVRIAERFSEIRAVTEFKKIF